HDLVVQDAFRIEFVTELVGKVGRWLVFARIRAITFPERSVALLAIRRKERLPFLDQIGRGFQRALLFLPAVWNGPPRILRGRGQPEREDEDHEQSEFPHARIIVPSMQSEQQRIGRSRRWFLRAAALFGGGFAAWNSATASAADLPNRLGAA